MNISDKVIKRQEQAEKDKIKGENQLMLDRCVPIARAVQKLIVDQLLPMGELPRGGVDRNGKQIPLQDADRPQEYRDAARAVLQMFLDADIQWYEKELIFQLSLQPFDMLRSIVVTDSERIWSETVNAMMGVESLSDLTFGRLNELVKQWHPKMAQKAVNALAPETASAETAPDPMAEEPKAEEPKTDEAGS